MTAEMKLRFVVAVLVFANLAVFGTRELWKALA